MNDFTYNCASSSDSRELKKENTSSSSDEYLRIIAKINDLEAWHHLEAVNFGTESTLPGHQWIVTAQVLATHIPSIRNQPFVISLETGHRVGLVKE